MSLSVLVHSASSLGDQKQDNLKFFTVITLEGKLTYRQIIVITIGYQQGLIDPIPTLIIYNSYFELTLDCL